MTKILCVDDELLMQRAYRRTLGTVPGIDEVILAGSVTEAIQLFRASPESYGVIFTDYEMNDGTGIDLLERVKQVDLLERIRQDSLPPRVLLSGRMNSQLCGQAMEAGAAGGIHKPFDNAFLQIVAGELIGQGTSPALDSYMKKEGYI
ncbi:MAG: response regulator [Nanoarchaeota archaeon]